MPLASSAAVPGYRFLTSVVGLPETGELDSRGLGLAFLPDRHFIKKPATASPPTVVTDAHPARLAQTHGLDEELVVLEVGEGEQRVKHPPSPWPEAAFCSDW